MEYNIHPQAFFPNYKGYFKDERLERRRQELWKRLSEQPCSSIRKLSISPAEQKAFYRFLNNERMNEEELINEASFRMGQLAKGRHLLCVQDTCEVNMGKHKRRLKTNSGLGRSDKFDSGHCFKIHPGLVLDATTLSPLGFSHIKVFHRPEEMPKKDIRVYKEQPIENKESYKWIEVAQKSKEFLQGAETVTFIEDREGDIYEQFAMVPDERHHLLIRSRTDRKSSNGSLYEEMDSQPVAGSYTIEIPTDNRKHQFKRQAHIELRFKACSLICPKRLIKRGHPRSITVNCISVKEIGNVTNPVQWKLLTTHTIETYEQALIIVQWYSARWYIEQLFRLLKKQGFGIEETELESGWAIRKLVIMQMTALLKILQMSIAYSQPEGGQPIEEVFNEEQLEVLHIMNKKLQGGTHKLQNNNDPKRTKWAAWILGRLGGWKGYDSQGPPGVIVLKRGLERLNYLIEGINIAKDVGTQ